MPHTDNVFQGMAAALPVTVLLLHSPNNHFIFTTMQIVLRTQFNPVSFKHMIACWENEANPGVEIGCIRIHPGAQAQAITGLGPNAVYLLKFYGSDNAITKDILVDILRVSTMPQEVNYECI